MVRSRRFVRQIILMLTLGIVAALLPVNAAAGTTVTPADRLQQALNRYTEDHDLKDRVALLSAPATATERAAYEEVLTPHGLQQLYLRALTAQSVTMEGPSSEVERSVLAALTEVLQSPGWQRDREEATAVVLSNAFLKAATEHLANLPSPRNRHEFLAAVAGPADIFPQLVGLATSLIVGIAAGLCYATPSCKPFQIYFTILNGALVSGTVLAATFFNSTVVGCAVGVSANRSGSDMAYGGVFACRGLPDRTDLSVYLVEDGTRARDGFIQPFFNQSSGSASQTVFASFPGCFSAYAFASGTENGREFLTQPVLSRQECYA